MANKSWRDLDDAVLNSYEKTETLSEIYSNRFHYSLVHCDFYDRKQLKLKLTPPKNSHDIDHSLMLLNYLSLTLQSVILLFTNS